MSGLRFEGRVQRDVGGKVDVATERRRARFAPLRAAVGRFADVEVTPEALGGACERVWTYNEYFGNSHGGEGAEAQVLRMGQDGHFDLVSKRFNGAQLHLSHNFPLRQDAMLAIFQVLAATDEQYNALERFFATSLNGGFPVKFSLPVLPAISMLVTFGACELCSPDPSHFVVPAGYREGGFKNILQRNS